MTTTTTKTEKKSTAERDAAALAKARRVVLNTAASHALRGFKDGTIDASSIDSDKRSQPRVIRLAQAAGLIGEETPGGYRITVTLPAPEPVTERVGTFDATPAQIAWVASAPDARIAMVELHSGWFRPEIPVTYRDEAGHKVAVLTLSAWQTFKDKAGNGIASYISSEAIEKSLAESANAAEVEDLLERNLNWVLHEMHILTETGADALKPVSIGWGVPHSGGRESNCMLGKPADWGTDAIGKARENLKATIETARKKIAEAEASLNSLDVVEKNANWDIVRTEGRRLLRAHLAAESKKKEGK